MRVSLCLLALTTGEATANGTADVSPLKVCVWRPDSLTRPAPYAENWKHLRATHQGPGDRWFRPSHEWLQYRRRPHGHDAGCCAQQQLRRTTSLDTLENLETTTLAWFVRGEDDMTCRGGGLDAGSEQHAPSFEAALLERRL